jgi:large subunit ribosomal protein L30
VADRIKVRQIRSGIGFERNQKETLRSMGFKRLNQVVDLPDNPAVRGMIYTVRHLVELVEGAGTQTGPRRAMARRGSE